MSLREVNTLEELAQTRKISDDAEFQTVSALLQKNISRQTTPTKYLQRKGLAYGKDIDDKHNAVLLATCIRAVERAVPDESLKEYIIAVITRCTSEGSAFNKNDIIDALILSSLSSADRILTFDHGVIQHMEKHSNVREDYKNSVFLINDFSK